MSPGESERVSVPDAMDRDDVNAKPNDIKSPGHTPVNAKLTSDIMGKT